MFSKYLFSIMIVLSVFSAASSALAQEGDLPETTPASGAIIETALESEGDSGNDTAPAGLLPEEVAAVMNETSAAEGCSMMILPAVEDVYMDTTETEVMVYNDDHLVCECVKGYEYEDDDYPRSAMIQFNLSDLELQENDVAVLVIKAESMERVGKEMVLVGFVMANSEWTENSSADILALNIESAKEPDFSQMGMSFGGDNIFAFDVSEHLKAADDDRISFFLVAAGDADYKVSFKSRETGEGPALLIIPYPSVPPA